MCFGTDGPGYRLCLFHNPFFSSPSNPPKRSRVKRYQTLTLSVFLVSQTSYQVGIPQVSMAALRQSPGFKVVKLLEGNAASRSGHSGKGECKGGWGEERRLLGFWLFGSENEAWR